MKLQKDKYKTSPFVHSQTANMSRNSIESKHRKIQLSLEPIDQNEDKADEKWENNRFTGNKRTDGKLERLKNSRAIFFTDISKQFLYFCALVDSTIKEMVC